MHVFRTLTILIGCALTMIGFQNFGKVPLSRLRLAALKMPSAEAATVDDIRVIAPRRPASLDEPILAQPQSGTDLGSISQDWLTRQARLITGGEDQKLLDDVNKKLSRAARRFGDGESSTGAGSTEQNPDEIAERPLITSFRMAAINRFEVGIVDSANLSCAMNGTGMQIDLSKPLSDRMNVNLRHDSGTNSSTLQLRYAW